MDGELLDDLRQRITAQLEKKRLTVTEREHYEILQIFVVYLIGDHPKVRRMWNTYVPMAWIMAIAAATFIGLLVSGRVSVVIK